MRQDPKSIYLFCLKPKVISWCLLSAAQPPRAVDTCTPVDHERRGLLLLHRMHRLPETEEIPRALRAIILQG